jgi:hypothetical protein
MQARGTEVVKQQFLSFAAVGRTLQQRSVLLLSFGPQPREFLGIGHDPRVAKHPRQPHSAGSRRIIPAQTVHAATPSATTFSAGFSLTWDATLAV